MDGHLLRVSRALVIAATLLGCHEATHEEVVYPTSALIPTALTPTNEEIAIGVFDAGASDDDDPRALDDFRPALEPYGSWIDDDTYGSVWVPSPEIVGPDFGPYVTAGHWVHDDGYVWVSDYPWGWAPFHYGRWVWIASVGWAWVPGRVYAGAWVAWRVADDGAFIGWAPMPPLWIWRHRARARLAFVPVTPYVFCPAHHIFAPSIAPHVVTGARVPEVFSQTRIYVPAHPTVGSAHPNAGPPPRALGIPAPPVAHGPRPAPELFLPPATHSMPPSRVAPLATRAPPSPPPIYHPPPPSYHPPPPVMRTPPPVIQPHLPTPAPPARMQRR